jgi:Arc/MetJ-type ribon-helix-helix transcriptional regulator
MNVSLKGQDMPEMFDKPRKEYRIPTVDLNQDLHERLTAYIKSHDKEPSIADVVRSALDRFLPKKKKEKGGK